MKLQARGDETRKVGISDPPSHPPSTGFLVEGLQKKEGRVHFTLISFISKNTEKRVFIKAFNLSKMPHLLYTHSVFAGLYQIILTRWEIL